MAAVMFLDNCSVCLFGFKKQKFISSFKIIGEGTFRFCFCLLSDVDIFLSLLLV